MLVIPGDLWLSLLQAQVFGFSKPKETPNYAPGVTADCNKYQCEFYCF